MTLCKGSRQYFVSIIEWCVPQYYMIRPTNSFYAGSTIKTLKTKDSRAEHESRTDNYTACVGHMFAD